MSAVVYEQPMRKEVLTMKDYRKVLLLVLTLFLLSGLIYIFQYDSEIQMTSESMQHYDIQTRSEEYYEYS